jgi:hypothetical protein
MKIIIETRNDFFSGWLAEILEIQLPQHIEDLNFTKQGRETAASCNLTHLLQGLRLELKQGVRNLKVSCIE